ncbi:glycosyltransferase family 2 protein [Parapedobacter sp. ISTM3]|uniref:Glycosyltransferase involved in cell wall bisynthesis n=1 Tax=Parapedobacter luteus TaxID=623280 RepID=A0A1T5FQU7_9SPHI|nr:MULTISPECIES: glycosyltransferase family 2 protein [Parapedobacter]MBK1441663.1 glycosyltransferase family 2 protein [Parapedobacter sp. ISTM3]SKB98558.1 Glycosyltransferase involved in cell wall bisynthesis [Parapedobacter luteus]
MKLDLTIVIPAKNEEKNLPGCLEAIGQDFAQQVVLVDSGSTDRTRTIAENYGATYINFQWDGQFPKKRNWYLRNHTPATEWVLFLDADEYLTPTFKRAVEKALADTTKVGYWLNYTVYFMGKKLKGGYPLKKLALFRVGTGEYEYIDEKQWSHLDMEIHEHPILTGDVGIIKAKIDHRDFRGVAHYVNKHNEYSSWEAARYLKMMTAANKALLTKKQRIKYRLLRTPLIGPAFFFGSFFLMGGFLDGARGFAFAVLKMAYFTEIYCKIKEKS